MKLRDLLSLMAGVMVAAPALAESPAVPATRGSVSAGAELSDTESRRIHLAGSFDSNARWSANAGFARSDFELPDGETQATLAAANLSYDFGRFSVGAGFRHTEIDDVSRSRDWLVRGSTGYGEWRFGLEAGRRASTLAPSSFVEDLGAGIGVASGTSRCSVDALGYKANVDLDRPGWSAFFSVRVFDYDDFDCALEIDSPIPPPDNGPPPHARGRALGRRLAAGTLDPVVGVVSRLVPREASLIESSVALGFTTPIAGRWIGGVEIDRDVEQLDGSEYLTGLVSAGTRLDDTWTLEFSLGYSKADVIDDSAFAGVRVAATLR